MKKLLLPLSLMAGAFLGMDAQTMVTDVFSAGSQIYEAAGTTQGGRKTNTTVTSDITGAVYTLSSSGEAWPTTCVYASATGSAAPGVIIVPKGQYIEITMPENCVSTSFTAYQLTSNQTCSVIVSLDDAEITTFTVGNIVDGVAQTFTLDNVEGGKTYKFLCTCADNYKYMWRIFNFSYTIASSSEAPMPNPVFTPAAGAVRPGTEVTILVPGYDNAQVRYTLNGTEPTAESTVYSGPIVINEPLTIKAMVMGQDDKANSEIVDAAYTLLDVKNFKLITDLADLDETLSCVLLGKGDDSPVLYFTMAGAEAGDQRTAYCLPDDQILGNYLVDLDNNQAQYLTITKGQTGKDEYPYLLGVGDNMFLGSSGTAANGMGLSTTEKTKLCYASMQINSVNNSCVISFNNYDVEGYALLFSSLTKNTSKFNYFPLTGTAARLPIYLYQETNDTPTGIGTVVENDGNVAAEYYNLQGQRVFNPQHGLYILRQGQKAKKILL